jgi:hypothetical protein
MIVDLAADIRPLVMAQARIAFRLDLVSDLAPAVSFGGQIGTNLSLASDLAAQVTIAGDIEVYSPTSFAIIECGTF